ncbi:MAG: DUF4326 domain-containing protein [Cyclobacteriaceae bacterium]
MKDTTITPRRIQRKRTKGFRLADECKNPNGYVICDRTSRFGNPIPWKELMDTMCIDSREAKRRSVILFRRFLLEPTLAHRDLGYKFFRIGNNLEKLRGKDLVCWCSLDEPCHCDVLLELANQPEELQLPKSNT